MLLRKGLAALALGGTIVTCVPPAGAVVVQVSNAWVHSALEGQTSTDAYMDLHADTALRLVGASSPWANRIEVRHGSNAMGARAAGNTLEMPANKDVHLMPDGYHLVLVGVGRDISNGAAVPITLEFEDAARLAHRVDVTAEARGNMFPPGPPPPPLVR